jgi:hypothetical protein
MTVEKIACPFVYADGSRCSGKVRQARAYGPEKGGNYVARADVKKYRLWCSEKDDHEGAVPSTVGKLRMEFYPDELPAEVIDRLWSENLLS